MSVTETEKIEKIWNESQKMKSLKITEVQRKKGSVTLSPRVIWPT